MGSVLSIQRRIECIRFARDTGSYLVEDDYDSEYRSQGSPIRSLYELDPERVIYIGSFSKIFAPALRLGYMILPQSLVKTYRHLKKYSDVHTPSIEQLAMAGFIREGQLERHISKMRKVYARRRETLLEGLRLKFKDRCSILGDSAGLHLVADFQDARFDGTMEAKALACGVKIYPVGEHALEKGAYVSKLILGYGHLDQEKLMEGLERLRRVVYS